MRILVGSSGSGDYHGVIFFSRYGNLRVVVYRQWMISGYGCIH